jgi:putative membrane protein (TIGR04086 family)
MSREPHKKHKVHTRKTREYDNADFQTITKYAVFGALMSILSVTVMTPIFSALCLLFPDPSSLAYPCALIILYLSCAVGGFICSQRTRRHKGAALICGAMSGFCIFILFGIVGIVLSLLKIKSPEGSNTVINVALKSISVPSAFLGAYLTTKIRKVHHRRKK